VNCSAPSYNLGARKLADWQRSLGNDVTTIEGDPGWTVLGYDRVCLSVIFSWHMEIARDAALRVKDHAEVWAGGPAMYENGDWFLNETQIEPNRGRVDARFDQQRGDYAFTFATRGCDQRCKFCIVWQMEGDFTFHPDFNPAPTLCDSNLSGIPVDWQEHIIARYAESGVRMKDCNSGFEPHSFDAGTRARWEPIIKRTGVGWRWAFDEKIEEAECVAMAALLADVSSRRKRVYCLLGNENIAECVERARKIIEWGAEPYCQVWIPLQHRDPDPKTARARFDWGSAELLYDAKRYFNSPQIWHTVPIWEYKADRSYRQFPFAFLKPTTVSA
jgi:hypothetical protein